MTRTRTGSVKPKHFDDESYITPSKRKASAPVQASESKKVKVELVGTVHNVEQPEAGRSTSKKDESMGKSSGEKAEEIPSDSETDLSTVAKPGTKITVSLAHCASAWVSHSLHCYGYATCFDAVKNLFFPWAVPHWVSFTASVDCLGCRGVQGPYLDFMPKACV